MGSVSMLMFRNKASTRTAQTAVSLLPVPTQPPPPDDDEGQTKYMLCLGGWVALESNERAIHGIASVT